jgi:hypothetical protein
MERRSGVKKVNHAADELGEFWGSRPVFERFERIVSLDFPREF